MRRKKPLGEISLDRVCKRVNDKFEKVDYGLIHISQQHIIGAHVIACIFEQPHKIDLYALNSLIGPFALVLPRD